MFDNKILKISYNVFSKILWLMLYLLCCWYSFIFFTIGLDCICIDFGHSSFLNFYIYSGKSVGIFGIVCLIVSYYFSNLGLYIFSYKLYTGKRNWYKFCREREKAQRKQNAIDYKNYIKGR